MISLLLTAAYQLCFVCTFSSKISTRPQSICTLTWKYLITCPNPAATKCQWVVLGQNKDSRYKKDHVALCKAVLSTTAGQICALCTVQGKCRIFPEMHMILFS